jgi:glycosyltransferase involved in cell wall biosynthesis
VLAQTHRALLLHVVGDGCTPATAAAVRAVGDPRVRFTDFPKGRGYGYAHRNVVLRQASAPYIAYATDDDLWFPDHLERALAELRRREVGLVAFRSCPVEYPGVANPYFFSFDWGRDGRAHVLRDWFMGSVECVHRRSVFQAVGYWDERLARFGDREFYNRVRRSSAGSAYVDTVTALRFYADQWDRHYAALSEPPQKRYLALLGDPGWRDALREAAARPDRPVGIRVRQWQEFLSVGARYAPRFLRFWSERIRAILAHRRPRDDQGDEGRSARQE